MNTNLFKNFKSLKEKADEIKDDETVKEDNVSVKIENHTEKLVVEQVSKVKSNDVAESSKIVKKNRPVKKEILDAKSLLQVRIGEEKKNIYAKTKDENLAKRTFTIFLKSDSLEFIKNLVFYKATVEQQIFYNQSEALVEALELLKNNFKNIKHRPEFIRDQEKTRKGGRKRNSDEIYDATTTVYIPGQYFEFIKDVTYNKVIEGDLYYKDWDLLELGIIELKKKYGENIQPRPDYIREDEKQRGRKAKVNS